MTISTAPDSATSPTAPCDLTWLQRHAHVVATIASALILASGTVIAALWADQDAPGDPPPPKPKASVTEPTSATVGKVTPFSGRISDLPTGHVVWHFVKDTESGALYPGYSPCPVNDDVWDCGGVFPVRSAKESDIYVAVVDAQAAADIMRWVIQTKYEKSRAAFEQPAGVVFLDKVRVISEGSHG